MNDAPTVDTIVCNGRIAARHDSRARLTASAIEDGPLPAPRAGRDALRRPPAARTAC
ncbi:hypothetical protein G3N57_30855 [Paraburkholderia sp. Se-20369]|nr:hypothetical protein [Paraburkholderia sp. Se-20369]